MPEENSERLNRTDRELLLGLKLDVRYMREEIKELVKEAIKDHESRIRHLEDFRWWILGGIAASAGLASFLTTLYAKH